MARKLLVGMSRSLTVDEAQRARETIAQLIGVDQSDVVVVADCTALQVLDVKPDTIGQAAPPLAPDHRIVQWLV